jgi:putative aldouronate transport system permease protein
MTTVSWDSTTATAVAQSRRRGPVVKIKRHWQLYLLISVPTAFLLVFNYWPMVGVQLAFRAYNPLQGMFGSPWVGMQEMNMWLQSPYFWPVLANTLVIGIYTLIVGTSAAIILALALNEVKHRWFKKTVQTITYTPYFISVVVLVGMMQIMLATRDSPWAKLFGLFNGHNPPDLFGNPSAFASLFVWSGVWQATGYGAVIYLAALTSVNPELYEAARIDGASRLQRIRNIDWPAIRPTVIVLVILAVGGLLNAASFEKAYLMQTPLNLSTSEVISTYVYKIGLLNGNFSFAAAVGLFNSVVGFVLLVITNLVARLVSETSLF